MGSWPRAGTCRHGSTCAAQEKHSLCLIPLLYCGCSTTECVHTAVAVPCGLSLEVQKSPHCLHWTHFFHWWPLFLRTGSLSISVGVCYGQAHWLSDYAGVILMTCHVPTSIHCVLIYHLTHKEQSYFPYIRVLGWCLSIGPAIISSSYTW